MIIEELVRSGVTHCFLAPGSRSTPLAVAAAQHPRMQTTVHFDERGTAFAALGYGRATGRPALWVTTSGTAVANGLPAVIEAFIDGVPLLLLTADRPPELRRTGANQTIRQPDLFSGHVKWAFDAPAPTTDIGPAFVLTTIDQAVHRARIAAGGPVHINWMFREPLAPFDAGPSFETYLDPVAQWLDDDEPYTDYATAHAAVDHESVSAFCRRLRDVRRGVIVAGRMKTSEEARAVMRLAAALRWPLLADIASQARLGVPIVDVRVEAYDLMLDENTRPPRLDAVLLFGRRPASKRLFAWIDATSPSMVAVVDDSPERLDPTHQVTHRFETGIGAFAEACIECLAPGADAAWLQRWMTVRTRVQNALDAFWSDPDMIDEPRVARLVSCLVPGTHALFVAGSMPIRDLDVYAVGDGAHVPVGANRGASGIDGTVATAIGYSIGLGRSVTVLLGDLAFLHDLNSLAMLRDAPHPLVLVVINNDGGGIFSFLPIAAFETVFEPYFGTPHGLRFREAAGLFGLHYEAPADAAGFAAAYQQAVDRPASTLIEVHTRREDNVNVHRMLQEQVARALGSSLFR